MNLDSFHVLRPWWLLGFIPVVWILWRLTRTAQAGHSWQRLCDPHLLPHLLIGKEGTKNKGAWMLLGVGWSCALVALAGPAWTKIPQPVVQSESALVMVLDLSRSMDAQDIRPSRLARGKHKVLDILKRRTEGQTGMVVFAHEPFVVSPLTEDEKTIAAMVPTLVTDLMPVQGSRPALALQRADQLLEQSGIGDGTILLLTDGLEGNRVLRTAQTLREQGRRVSVLGIGSKEGAPIPLANGGFLKDQSGAIVIPKLDQAALREVAQLGGGQYAMLRADDRDLDSIFRADNDRPSIKETSESERTTDLWREEGPWLVLAILLLGIPAFRQGWFGVVFFICFLSPLPVHAWTWEDLWSRPDQQGAQQLQQGNPEAAAELFHDDQWKGVAHYQSGAFEEAAEVFGAQKDPDSFYNRGNALARLGRYQEALQAYEHTLKQLPDHEDAQHNADIMKQLLQQQHSSQSPQRTTRENQENSQDSESLNQQGQNQNDSQGQPQSSSEENRHAENGKGGRASASSPMEQSGEEEKISSPKNRESEREADQLARNQHSVPSQPESTKELKKESPSPKAGSMNEEEENQEERQATQQWLRRIPDDPGGLLRRKVLLEHRRRGNSQHMVEKAW